MLELQGSRNIMSHDKHLQQNPCSETIAIVTFTQYFDKDAS